MSDITEIAPNLFRISVYAEAFDLQFNHFLVRDEEPLLYHTGMRQMFPEVREAVAKIIDPSSLRWISWSHFEVDECGALNAWLETAPHAAPVCGVIGGLVNVTDFSDRPPKMLEPGQILETGERRYRFHSTPHLPHGWDAGAMFEETTATLFCSDLLHQAGRMEPITESDVILERTREAILAQQATPLMDYVPYTHNTGRLLGELADFNPKTLAIMHGSSFSGDGGRLLRGLDPIFREVLGTPDSNQH
ncbi:MAG: MBL fold metallo-hydrolase [Candidatus Omnitrophica bacterium]|nr:MBL fold metallo-hydrolase [Candidatus Omnitrophota bacterium]